MSRQSAISRLPWQDRWSQPSVEQLMAPLKLQHRRLFDQIMNELAGYERVDRVVIWYGQAWNWTIQYRLLDAKGGELDTLCYLVPKVESPLICIPLRDQIIRQIPLKRLSKFVRDGVKVAKHAVAIHWATWSPNSKAEVAYLSDLLKRKCKLMAEVNSTAHKGANGKSTPAPGSAQNSAPGNTHGNARSGNSAGTAHGSAQANTHGSTHGTAAKSSGGSGNSGGSGSSGGSGGGKPRKKG